MKQITPAKKLSGEIFVPGDKSISHRAVMLSAIAEGTSHIDGFLAGEDCLSTIDCFRKLGIEIEHTGNKVTVHGKGIDGLRAPDEVLYTGNSGTTTRLITGLLAGQSFESEIDGDASIRKRPMGHVKKPLDMMGAKIDSEYCPLKISPGRLKGISYDLPVASAQLKSALILAGLYAEGPTTITEPSASRDHTERMLSSMGANLVHEGNTVTVYPGPVLRAQTLTVPGDISSAAFFMVAAAIVPDSEITVKNVGINETRTGIIDVLLSMGADIKIQNKRLSGGEEVADITVKSSKLTGTVIEKDIIARLIDEIPVLAVAAAFAEGTTVIKDASQLKIKESNRIDSVVSELKKAGVNVTATDDGMIICGGSKVSGAEFDTYNDHRIAMSMAVLALAAEGDSYIKNPRIADISFPGFYELLDSLKG